MQTFSEVMPIRKSNDTLFYLIGIVPIVWLALLLAQSLGAGATAEPDISIGAADKYRVDR